MFPRSLVCVLAVAALSAVVRGEVTVAGVEILGFGEYRIAKGESSASGTSPSKRIWTALPEVVTAGVDTIEATLGINFGFHYSLKGAPSGEPVQIKTVIRFPEPGITTPEGALFKSSEYVVTRTIGGQYYVGYGFDNAWEIVGGEWTIQLWYADSLLIQKTFHVIVPSDEGAASGQSAIALRK